MARITVSKTVYWNDGSKEVSGVVKQIMQDHAVIETATGRHIVTMAKLSLKPAKPAQKTASSQTTIISKGA